MIVGRGKEDSPDNDKRDNIQEMVKDKVFSDFFADSRSS